MVLNSREATRRNRPPVCLLTSWSSAAWRKEQLCCAQVRAQAIKSISPEHWANPPRHCNFCLNARSNAATSFPNPESPWESGYAGSVLRRPALTSVTDSRRTSLTSAKKVLSARASRQKQFRSILQLSRLLAREGL